MRILLDGRDDIFVVDGPTKFEELWDEILDLCSQSNRAIERLVIDGEEIMPDQVEGFYDRDLNEFSIIEIETCGEQESALEDLVEANSTILDAIDIVKHFLEGGSLDYNDVVMSVINAMNSWEKACRKIDLASKTLGVDYTRLKFANTDFSSQHQESIVLINKLTLSLSNKDVVSIRDILEYEFLPQLQSYTELIKEIVNQKAKEDSQEG